MNILRKLFTPRFSENSGTKRVAVLFAALLVLLFAALFASLSLGPTAADPISAFKALLFGDLKAPDYLIIFHLRLPRALAAILAGAALAVAGVIIQAVLNNPMAAPNVIGVNAGAGFCAVLLMSAFPSLASGVPIAAFIGALCTSLCIWLIAQRSGAGRVTVTLVGVAVGSILTAGINTLKTLFPDSVYDASAFSIGGLSGVGYSKLALPAIIIAICLILAHIFSGGLDILCFGAESAGGLGMNVTRARFLYLMLASALAGAAVSFSGLIGFVGLLVPHIMRRFVGTVHRRLIPASALGGALLLTLCDLAARTVFSPYELPVGIILSLVGGPFFVALILLDKRRDLYD